MKRLMILFATCLLLPVAYAAKEALPYLPASTKVLNHSTAVFVIGGIIATGILIAAAKRGWANHRYYVALLCVMMLTTACARFLYTPLATPEEYEQVNSLVKKDPTLLTALPFYVNQDCVMTHKNYRRFSNLAKKLPSLAKDSIPKSSLSKSQILHACSKTLLK